MAKRFQVFACYPILALVFDGVGPPFEERTRLSRTQRSKAGYHVPRNLVTSDSLWCLCACTCKQGVQRVWNGVEHLSYPWNACKRFRPYSMSLRVKKDKLDGRYCTVRAKYVSETARYVITISAASTCSRDVWKITALAGTMFCGHRKRPHPRRGTVPSQKRLWPCHDAWKSISIMGQPKIDCGDIVIHWGWV